MEQYEQKVKDIIVEQLGVTPEKITPEASFIDDLGADSLDTVELVMAFEDAFGIEIPDEGLVLKPNQLYLARTAERTITHNLVPQIEGRSSVGRLGLFVHVTAGFGDVGFSGYWTLEMFAVHQVKVYPGVPICQIFYHELTGQIDEYASKYQHNRDIQPSLMFEEFTSGQDDDPQLPLDFGFERSHG